MWEDRVNGLTKKTFDYVFYLGDSLEIIKYLAIPEEKLINFDVTNPCINYPSDHYSIAFTFKF